jgi:hypothetical protein
MAADPTFAHLLQNLRLRWRDFVLVGTVGLLVFLMNFPRLAKQLLDTYVAHPALHLALGWPLLATQASLSHLRQTSAEAALTRLLSLDFRLVFLLVALAALLALRRRSAALLGSLFAGLLAGTSSVPLLGWLAVVVRQLFIWIGVVLSWLHAVGAWVGHLFGWLWAAAVHYWWLLVPLVLLVLAWRGGRRLIALLQQKPAGFGKVLLWTVLAAGAIAVAWWAIGPVGAWLRFHVEPIFTAIGHVLSPVLHFLGRLLRWLIAIVLVVLLAGLALNVLGRLLVDQVRSAWCSGRGSKEMALVGFAVGSALALILVMSAGMSSGAACVDAGWHESLTGLDHLIGVRAFSAGLGWIAPARAFWIVMPGFLTDFATHFFDNANPPLVDSLLLLVILALACLTTLRSIFVRRAAGPEIAFADYFLPQEYFAVFAALVLSLVAVAVQGWSEGTDT